MGTIIAFLTFALFVALIVGLIKPALVLQWDKKTIKAKGIPILDCCFNSTHCYWGYAY